ncbi:MAG TPA: sodium-dependent transporter [Longimicrobiales bacterium]|nr:sodium-dependent transporter [Longimicrobiales bacterium]
MPDPIDIEVKKHSEDSIQRELWGTRVGFILAAVGSAVGLGNMWRFPYRVSEGGGAAFVVLYIALTLIMGIPLMLSEFSVGRRTRLSPIGAFKKEGGKRWGLVGFLGVLTGFLILSYYSVIAGWVVRYGIEGIIGGFSADPGAHFGEITTGFAPIFYHIMFMVVTITIVSVGVEKGIEKASLILMPVLFTIVLGLAVWAFTLPGSAEGYSFYLAPSFSELLNPTTLAEAAGQAFFSLSLGMGAMLTFASYLSRHENLNREATTIAFSDFGVAFVAGLVVFPVIAALGLQAQVGESTVGALFIALPGAFVEMGTVGRVVGVAFFFALTVGAVTSAVSLLEVVTASMIDEFKIHRKSAAIGAGILITLVGLVPAMSLDALGLIDRVTEWFLALGALMVTLFVGWKMRNPQEEMLDGATGFFASIVPAILIFIRWVMPPIILFVVFYTGRNLITEFATVFGG